MEIYLVLTGYLNSLIFGNLNLNFLLIQIKNLIWIGLIVIKNLEKYTVALDGEEINGTAFFAQIRRETETWRSYIEYTDHLMGLDLI